MRKKTTRLLIALLLAVIAAGVVYFIPTENISWLQKAKDWTTEKVNIAVDAAGSWISSLGSGSESLPAVETENLEMAKVRNGVPVAYTGFTVSYDGSHKIPEWVVYELTSEEAFATDVSRSDEFWEDTRVKNYSKLSDYRGSGFDRGHMCPSNDQRWSKEANYDTFSLLNMVPQEHEYNAGIWLTAEKWVRNVAGKYGKVYVATGPVISDNMDTIGSGVAVPVSCWKALLVINDGKASSIALCIPQSVKKGKIQDYVMSVNELEQLTGLDLFYNLPDDVEEQIESMTSTKGWQM